MRLQAQRRSGVEDHSEIVIPSPSPIYTSPTRRDRGGADGGDRDHPWGQGSSRPTATTDRLRPRPEVGLVRGRDRRGEGVRQR